MGDGAAEGAALRAHRIEHLAQDLAGKAQPVGQAAAIIIPPLVIQRREELAEQIAVTHMDFDRVESSLPGQDRKSTRLNSSHVKISYAVFCLKKKTTTLA